MARRKDSNELKAIKKEATQKFVALVEANCKLGPKKLEEHLGIGDCTGIVWCAYRRGDRSMSPGTLSSKIKIAVKEGILVDQVAEKFHSEVKDQEFKLEIAEYTNESYVYDPRPFKLKEFSSAVEQLVIRANIMNEDHQAKDILTALAPLQTLILDLFSLTDECAKPLKTNKSVSVEELLLRDIKNQWGDMVPEKDVRKLFGVKHGLEISNGFATLSSVANKMAAMRKEALDAVN